MTAQSDGPRDAAARGEALVHEFAGARIVVVGDVMLDRFIVGRVSRISPEAPVPVVRFTSEHVRLGGAANVAHNVAALGGRVAIVGVIGDDDAGERLADEMQSAGIDIEGLVVDTARTTTEKVRVVTERNQQVARIDYEHDADADGALERTLIEKAAHACEGASAVLVSDYLKGTITRPLIEALLRNGAQRPLIVDPKIPHLACYAGATLITPNQLEAETATHRRIGSDDDARMAAARFRQLAQCAAVLITRGEHGMWLSDAHADTAIPSVAREVSDVTGAGDTVVATLALALAAGGSLVEAARLANQAAGIVVGKFGPATVDPDELIASVATL